LTAESDSIAHKILNDLMLLSPDLASMVGLQQRRVALLSAETYWKEAKTAAVLCATMANATTDGPIGCANRCTDIMRFADAPATEVERFRGIWSGEEGEAIGGPTAMVDSLLAGAAKAALETSAKEQLPPRRLAYLHLLAGQAEEALRHIHTALTQAKDESEIFDRLDDVQTILSASGSGLWNSDGFSRWLASASGDATRPKPHSDLLQDYLVGLELDSGGTVGSSQTAPTSGAAKAYSRMSRGGRAGMAAKHLARRRQRLIRWGADALRDKEHIWSRKCLAAAINMQQKPESLTVATDSAVAAAVCAKGAKDVVQFLETVVPLVHSRAGRRHLLYRLAVAHYNQSAYEESLKCLDSSDALSEDPAGKQHMAAGILRARSLIELARYEDAAGILAGMEGWPGTPKQQARVLFLTGWTCLQSSDTAGALSAFQEVVRRFAETAVADEAARVIGALEGT